MVDGLRPQDIGLLTPRLRELKEGGTWYEQARGVYPAETLPNHAAMATGVLPQRNGIIANQYFQRTFSNQPRLYMHVPELLESDTMVTQLERAFDTRGGIQTATVLSKLYLYGLFQGEYEGAADPLPQRSADFHWNPLSAGARFVTKPSEHAIDQATMEAFLGWVKSQRDSKLPQFGWLNLGDVDRSGHADESGAALPDGAISAFRQAALEDTDAQIGLLVDELKSSGVWDDSVVILLSDHGMDWSLPHRFHDSSEALGDAGYGAPNVDPNHSDYWQIGGGGSELVYVHHERRVAEIARVVSGARPAVEFVATPELIPNMPGPNVTLREMGIDHPRSPPLQAFMAPGWRSSPDRATHNNPVPGNHGHALTQHVTLMVTGGDARLRDSAGMSVPGGKVYDPSRATLFAHPAEGPGVMSVAPTVTGLFGIGEPLGGYDGEPLREAFEPSVFSAASSGPGDGPGGADAPSATGGRPTGGLTTTLRSSRNRARYLQSFQLSGRVTAASACDAPRRVNVYRGAAARPAAARLIATAGVGTDGRWSRRTRSATNVAYFARVQPTPGCSGSLSGPVSVGVRGRVTATKSCRGRPRISGRVLPRAPGSRVYLLHRRAGRYRRMASRRLGAASSFAFPIVSCAGRYRVTWTGRPGRNLAASASVTMSRAR